MADEPQTEAYPGQFLPHSTNEPPGSKLAQQEPQAKPVVTTLNPPSCAIGGPDFTLFISGENFSDKSEIVFAGYPEPTTLNGDGTLSTGVKPSLWGAPVVVQCGVRNGAQMSDMVPFEFTALADIGTRGGYYGR
jgi:IPT/TIG domain